MPWLAAIPSAIGAIGGLMQGETAEEKAQKQAMAYLQSIGLPSVEAQQILLQNPEFVYQFQPEAEESVNLAPSAMEDISVDANLKDAQMVALAKMQQLGETSLTPVEKASLNQLRRDTANEEQARQGAILQNMAAKGQGGSGAELAARLSSSQAATDRASQESDRLQSMAYQRALDAIAQGGNMATGLADQEFGQKSQVAQASDAISKFNVMNQQNVQSANVAARNQAAQQYAQMQQDAANQAAAQANQQQMYNKQLLQQNFQNQLQKGQAMMPSAASVAAGAAGQQATAQGFQNLGSGIGGVVGGIIGQNKAPTTKTAATPGVQYDVTDDEKEDEQT